MATAAAHSLEAPAVETAGKPHHIRALRIWLWAVALLIVAMILVGGATRLTDSGLSITEWKPIVGIVPPLSDADWNAAFEAYKQIPEYSRVNPNMDLAGFKGIFWWEWGHRFLGRMIGFVFFLPFLAFWAAGYIPKKLWPKLIGLFVLGGLQGAVGWYMVKSGLIDRVDVSQYRLTAHFGFAILIFGYTLWLIFGLGPAKREPVTSRAVPWVAGLILGLIYLQLLLGALVAGLDAGFGYNTWPLIAGAFIPDGLWEATPWIRNFFDNPLTVQFDHRMVAYLVFAATIAQAVWLAATKKPQLLIGSGLTVAVIAMLQATLGVWTLLLAVPITLGLAHQAGAVVLFGAAVFHFWLATNGVPEERAQTLARA
ncbi:COX15/CtaA family protein [Methyloligella sp. 2.7D]|uniref:COX15/CtaA family protein n=1 Tax=unclassified Methyloligella TaxID=2625955 RepID=UPI00157D5FB5|nr:COX15/CtaA family protein [Methyloligella sp. GL2]QKP77578.1 COX15/CtaA family protein [Methyloligella sp. GL2]